LGIKGTYYFHVVPESYDERIIKQIAELGHEVGYHYENLSHAAQKIKNFKLKIKKNFRDIYPVKTICMHGSPLSKYDNRLLWEKYDYRDFGIVGSPCEIECLYFSNIYLSVIRNSMLPNFL